MIAFFKAIELYISERVLRQFGKQQLTLAVLMRPIQAHKPVNNRMYIAKFTFLKALWFEIRSHLLSRAWIVVLAILPHPCTHEYMSSYLRQTHPRIKNPDKLPNNIENPEPGHQEHVIILDMLVPYVTSIDLLDAAATMGRFKKLCRIMEEFHPR